MTAPTLLSQLTNIFPGFGPFWDDPGNCFRGDDGTFNFYGVFAQLASFLPARTTRNQRTELGGLVSRCAASPDADLSNAVSTCFLECVAGTPVGRALRPHLTGAALDYYLLWDE